MTPFSPENMERLGKLMQGAGRGLGNARDLAKDVKERVTPHIERGVDKLDKTFFGDKESGKEGLVEQFRVLREKMKGAYSTDGQGSVNSAFELKTSKHPSLSDAEYTVFDALLSISERKRGEEGRSARGQYPPIKPGEIAAFTAQQDSVVTKALFKLESMGLVTPKVVKSDAPLPLIASLKVTALGQTVFERCNAEPKPETPKQES